MTPDEYCQDKTAKSGSSFYYSFLFLPLERRRAIMALYAFCREVDDVVDESVEAKQGGEPCDVGGTERAGSFGDDLCSGHADRISRTARVRNRCQRRHGRLVANGALHEALVGPLAPDNTDDQGRLRDAVQTVTLLALRAVGVMDARARGLVVQAVLPAKALVGA